MLDESILSGVEHRLLRAAERGVLLDLRPDRTAVGDPVGDSAGGDRRVRGEFLVELLTGDLPDGVGTPVAVRVRGAQITGNLNLGGRTLRCPLALHECELGGRVSLARSVAPAVSFRGCILAKGLSARRVRVEHLLHLGTCTVAGRVALPDARVGSLYLSGARLGTCRGEALDAAGAVVAGDLLCDDGFTARGEVRIVGAQIGGEANFSGARLHNTAGYALSADGAVITGGLFCDDGFSARGEVRIVGAQIGGEANFSGARLRNRRGTALDAHRAVIAGDLLCDDGFTTRGQVQILGAQISGQASFTDARLHNPRRNALTADHAVIGGGLFGHKGFTARGEIRLLGAQIGGQIELSGARLRNPCGKALSVDRAVVTGGLICDAGFTARGEVRIVGAQIGGQIDLSTARLLNPGNDALSADFAVITGGLFCRDGFTAEGQVRIVHAQISGQAILSGAALRNPGRSALSADSAVITGSLLCDAGFTARGEVGLTGAQIGGQVDLCGARLLNPGRTALNAERATVTGGAPCTGLIAEGGLSFRYAHVGHDLDLREAVLDDGEFALDLERATIGDKLRLRCRIDGGIVVATGAQVGHLDDDPACWPAGSLIADLTYRTLPDDADSFPAARKDWATRHGGGYAPAVYDQIAAAYRAAGHTVAARQVLITKQWVRRRALPVRRPEIQVLMLPWRAATLTWSALLRGVIGYGHAPWRCLWWLAGVFMAGWWVFRQLRPGDLTAFHPEARETFHPTLYTLDLLVPVVNLGQRGEWALHGGYVWLATGFTFVGWLAATIIAAGLAGVFKRD